MATATWGFIGSWSVGPESAALEAAGGRIVFRFHSRDLHLVLAPGKDGRPVRFKLRLDGTPPGDAHGSDSAPDGGGEVRQPRLYQLIRQGTRLDDRTFEIEFLDPGVRAFVFTFGERKGEMRDLKLEVVVLQVSDVDRAKRFYEGLGWRPSNGESGLAGRSCRCRRAHPIHVGQAPRAFHKGRERKIGANR